MKTPLLKSRRFWTAVLDATISIVSVVVSLQFSADVQKVIMSIVVALQPVFIALILAFTVDDITTAIAQVRIAEAQVWAKEKDCCE